MQKEKKFNFVYLTTNLINGKQYVGDHSTNNLNNWKSQHYFGSGLHIQRSINHYKKVNFKREILEFFPNKKIAFEAQEKYIIQYNTLTPNGYNISPKGGMQMVGGCSDETKLKISNTKKGWKMTEKQKKQISETLSGTKKPPRTKEHSEKIMKTRKENGYIPWNKGKKMNEDFCEKARNRQKGKTSWNKGKKMKPESIEKLKQTLLNKKINKNEN